MFSSRTRKILSVLIMLGILLPSFSASAQINIFNDAARLVSCTISTLLRAFLQEAIDVIVTAIRDLIVNAICSIASYFTIGIVRCGYTRTQDGGTRTLVAKEYFRDVISRCIARQALSGLIGRVLTVMQTTGRDGGSVHVQNWRNFQTRAQYRGEAITRSMIYSASLCPHIRTEVRSLFGATGATAIPGQNTRVNNLDPFGLRVNCSLPSNFNIDQFRQNPNANGGWEAFLRLAQPQNSLYGVYFESLREMDSQRQVEQSGDIYETLGHGFTGARGDGSVESCLTRGLNGQCLVYRDIRTPGSVLSATVENTIKSEFDWIVSSDELNELLVDVTDVLIARVRDIGRGPTSSPTQVNIDPSLTSGLIPEPGGDPNGCAPGEIFDGTSCIPDPGTGSGGGTGACAAYVTASGASSLESNVRGAMQAALNRDPGLANSPATRGGNLEAFRDLVIDELNGSGSLEASTAYNGNCNVSVNQVAIHIGGTAVGEAYDVVRDDPNCSIEEAALGTGACSGFGRPNYVGDATWNFFTTGTP